MQKLIWKNSLGVEVDLTSGIDGTGPYMITEWEGFSGVEQTIQSQQVPFNDGSVYIDGLLGNRTLTVTLAIQDNNNLTTRYQLRRELIAALNPKLKEGYLIYKNDYIEKQIKCVPEVPIFETHNSDTSGTPKASLSWVACNPYWEDLEDIEVEFNDVHTINNAGDVPAQVKLSIPSVAGNPVIYNRRNSKKLELIGTQEDAVEINTNMGQKEVRSYKLGFKWQNGGTFTSCASSSNKIIFVGEQVLVENIITGETKSIDVGNAVDLKKIIYVNNKFIIIGSIQGKAMVLISTDEGETWQSQEITSTLYPSGSPMLNDIIFADSKYVMVSNSLVFVTSDLENWDEYVAGGFSIAYGNNLFVIAGLIGKIYVSSDAINWTQQSAFTTDPLPSIVFGKGKFYIAYRNNSSSGCYIASSSDGENWNNTYITNNGNFKSIAYGNDMFIAIGESIIATSTDGEIWNSATAQSPYLHLINGNINFTNSYFYSLSTYGRIYRTKDGASWENISNAPQMEYTAIAYGKGKYVAVGTKPSSSNAPATMWISDDGLTWNPKDVGGASIPYQDIVFGNDMFVAVGLGSGGTLIVTSTDGINWNRIPLNSSYTRTLNRVFYRNGLFWTVGDYGYIFTSTDGITWTKKNIGYSDYKFNSVAFNGLENNTVVILAEDNTYHDAYCLVSQDGGAFQELSLVNRVAYDVIFGNGIFIACSQTRNAIYRSEDGVNWTYMAFQSSYSINRFVFIDGLFYILGDNGLVLRSSDGITWIKQDCAFTVDLFGLASKDNFFIAVGESGAIAQSFLQSNLNLISDLTPDSDMTFDLEVGENVLFYRDDNGKKVKLTYRQRYVGV